MTPRDSAGSAAARDNHVFDPDRADSRDNHVTPRDSAGAAAATTMIIRETAEYAAIRAYYRDRTARRSHVPLIHHIDEGLEILVAIQASTLAQRAFCVHPLVQDNLDAAATIASPDVRSLAVEYARVANAALSTRLITTAADIELSPLADVNAMLVADKVQNRKDFIAHHRGTHPRGTELDRYFALWLERLGITDARYAELTALL